VAGFNSDGDGPGRVESVSVFYAYALLIPGNMQALFSGGQILYRSSSGAHNTRILVGVQHSTTVTAISTPI
jgi:hypothetical protein